MKDEEKIHAHQKLESAGAEYIGFMSAFKCPRCGAWHNVTHFYNGVPVMLCDKMPKMEILFYGEGEE